MNREPRATLPGRELRRIRQHLDLTMDAMAIELGYEGNLSSNRTTMKRFETGERPLPLPVARLAWLLAKHGVPEWPSGLEAVLQEDEPRESSLP
jgi:transcriptional regulator with XRE-family HTH domain